MDAQERNNSVPFRKNLRAIAVKLVEILLMAKKSTKSPASKKPVQKAVAKKKPAAKKK